MNCINNPALLSRFAAIGMAPIVAGATKCSKKTVVAKITSITPRLVVNVLAFVFSALLAYGVEDKIRFLCFCILPVFALALGGCMPQPAAAFEAIRSFEWSF